jgi:hypothetical protein
MSPTRREAIQKLAQVAGVAAIGASENDVQAFTMTLEASPATETLTDAEQQWLSFYRRAMAVRPQTAAWIVSLAKLHVGLVELWRDVAPDIPEFEVETFIMEQVADMMDASIHGDLDAWFAARWGEGSLAEALAHQAAR